MAAGMDTACRTPWERCRHVWAMQSNLSTVIGRCPCPCTDTTAVPSAQPCPLVTRVSAHTVIRLGCIYRQFNMTDKEIHNNGHKQEDELSLYTPVQPVRSVAEQRSSSLDASIDGMAGGEDSLVIPHRHSVPCRTISLLILIITAVCLALAQRQARSWHHTGGLDGVTGGPLSAHERALNAQIHSSGQVSKLFQRQQRARLLFAYMEEMSELLAKHSNTPSTPSHTSSPSSSPTSSTPASSSSAAAAATTTPPPQPAAKPAPPTGKPGSILGDRNYRIPGVHNYFDRADTGYILPSHLPQQCPLKAQNVKSWQEVTDDMTPVLTRTTPPTMSESQSGDMLRHCQNLISANVQLGKLRREENGELYFPNAADALQDVHILTRLSPRHEFTDQEHIGHHMQEIYTAVVGGIYSACSVRMLVRTLLSECSLCM